MLPPPLASTKMHSVDDDDDDAIRLTDDDAATCRISAVSLGYVDDPFATLLHRQSRMGSALMPPLINIGTYLRTVAIDMLIDNFLAKCAAQGLKSQILSLGAGSDTRFFRYAASPHHEQIVKYVEVDFLHVTSIKAQRIARSSRLVSLLNEQPETSEETPEKPPNKPYTVSEGGTQLTSKRYALIPLDLRSGRDSEDTRCMLEERIWPHLDKDVPTLLIGECVFCYMVPTTSNSILKWFGRHFRQSIAIVYEMFKIENATRSDAFGKVMVRNLAARNLSLPGVVFNTSDARFLYPGSPWIHSREKNMWWVRNNLINAKECERISQLERLDEVEELKLVLEHYCISWGVKGKSFQDFSFS